MSSISKILRGTALLSNEVLEIGAALLRGETPDSWANIWEGPNKAPAFIETVVIKTLAIMQHREQVLANTFFNFSLQLSSFFNPITFLNAHRQLSSRKLKRPMDTLQLVSSWDKSEGPLAVKVEGLLVQGCRFDGSRLLEAEPNDPIFSSIPVFNLAWLPQESVSKVGKVNIPVYSNSSREKCVTNLLVPCVGSYAPWVLAGVAFFISVE